MKEEHSSHTVPISQIIKEIPDILGIRLEKGAAYEVITANDGVEIRSYKSTQMASMTINGSFEKAKKEVTNFQF